MDFAAMKANELLERIQHASLQKLEEPVPAGFKNAEEWAKVWHRSRNTAFVMCQRAVKLGIMKMLKIRRANSVSVRQVAYFAEVKQ